jgi:hypothetical protein
LTPSDTDSAVNAHAEQLISNWLDATRRAKSQDFVELHNFNELSDGVRVQQNSEYWSARFFSQMANPYDQRLNAQRSVHHATPETFDVLRHAYDAVGKHLVVEETVNLVLITVDEPLIDFPSKDERQKQEAINTLAGLLLKMTGTMVAPNLQDAPYHWEFRFPSALHEGVRFSTDPTADPVRMWSWASRSDGGIYDNRLYFLCFKQRESTSGKLMSANGQHWFDGKCWDAFRR